MHDSTDSLGAQASEDGRVYEPRLTPQERYVEAQVAAARRCYANLGIEAEVAEPALASLRAEYTRYAAANDPLPFGLTLA